MPSLKEQIRIFKDASHDERIAMYDDLAIPMLKQLGKNLLIVIGVLILLWFIVPYLFYVVVVLIGG